MKRYTVFLFSFMLIILISGCDQRHNSKLPTGISPFDYIESNVIGETSNYLVRSNNDDFYLYINKQVIADSVLKKGDFIWFSHTLSLADRDSIAISDGMNPITDALYFYVYRDSVIIPMQFNPGMIKLYTKPLASLSNVKVLRFDEKFISSDDVTGISIDKGNAIIPITKTGFFQFYQEEYIAISVQFNGNGNAFYAWHPDFSMFLPADTQWNGKHLKFISLGILSTAQQTQVEHIFPNFALADKIISYELTGTVTTNLYPQIRIWKHPSRFTPQMVVLQPGTPGEILSLDSVDDLWVDQVTYKDVFCKYPGTYCYVIPMTEQNQITIPLDGSFSQLYFNRFYIDLRGTVLSNGSLNIDLSSYGRTLPAIYNGTVFNVTDPKLPITFSFMQNGTALATLPDSLWMEVGVSLPAGTDTSGQQWFGYHLDDSIEEEFYYTQGSAYDTTHFSVANQYLFFPLAVSGLYFLGTDSNTSQSFTIPVIRDAGYYQVRNMVIDYSGAQTANLSHYYLNMQPQVDLNQSIFQGQPYQMSGTQAAFRAGFYQDGSWTDTVPSSHIIQYSSSRKSRTNHVLIYDNANKWQKTVLLKSGNQVDDTHFVQSGSDYTIGGVMGGTYLLTNIENISSTNVDFALYSHLFLDFDRLKLFHDTSDSEPTGYKLRARIDQTFPDTRNIIQNQYQFQQISWNYHITAINPAAQVDTTFLKQYLPVLYFAQTQRPTPLLVHLNQDKDYRIYTYPQGTALTGYNFITANGFDGVIPSYNGDYCAFNDLATHSSITTLIHATTTELITSLYQAEFILPAYFVGTAFPIGYKINLGVTTDAPTGIQLISGYKLTFLDNNDNTVDLHLIQNYLTDKYPYIYLPFPPEQNPSGIHVRYVGPLGAITEYERVDNFSGNNALEYIVVGNCVILSVDARGSYLISTN
jgi:hypothetical protein